MTASLAAALTAALSLGGWEIARRSARARAVVLGAIPLASIAVGSAVAALAAPQSSDALRVVVLLSVLSVAAIVDARSGSIFDSLTLSLTCALLLISALHAGLCHALLGGAGLGAALLALRIATASRGLGLGDVKLGVGVGAGLGATLGAAALAAAFVFGGFYAGWLLATRRAQRDARIPFAPFVAAGTYAVTLLGAAGL
jgi:leader peptidase (prepilin peptidase)/N-methyltransferase